MPITDSVIDFNAMKKRNKLERFLDRLWRFIESHLIHLITVVVIFIAVKIGKFFAEAILDPDLLEIYVLIEKMYFVASLGLVCVFTLRHIIKDSSTSSENSDEDDDDDDENVSDGSDDDNNNSGGDASSLKPAGERKQLNSEPAIDEIRQSQITRPEKIKKIREQENR